MTRRLQTAERGRDAVLRRAAIEIAERGYHGMSMRELARATGRGLASFYRLFLSKEDILFELQRRAFEELCESAEACVGGAPGDAGGRREELARLRRFVDNHVRFVVADPARMRVLVQEAAALPPASRAAIRALKQRYFELGAGLLARAAARGGAGDTAEAERAAYCMFGMLNWIFGWYEPARHGGPDEIAATIFALVTRGIGADAP